jgi:hypothetical protein
MAFEYNNIGFLPATYTYRIGSGRPSSATYTYRNVRQVRPIPTDCATYAYRNVRQVRPIPTDQGGLITRHRGSLSGGATYTYRNPRPIPTALRPEARPIPTGSALGPPHPRPIPTGVHLDGLFAVTRRAASACCRRTRFPVRACWQPSSPGQTQRSDKGHIARPLFSRGDHAHTP